MELVTVHVVPVLRGWKIEAEGSSLPTVLRDSKEEALTVAHQMARRPGRAGRASILVHDRAGHVESQFPPASKDRDDA